MPTKKLSREVVDLRPLLSESGDLVARYHYEKRDQFGRSPLVYIENAKDQMQLFRICKNGKPIAFPFLEAGDAKVILLQDYMNVRDEDVITLTEHLEEYIYDGTEYD